MVLRGGDLRERATVRGLGARGGAHGALSLYKLHKVWPEAIEIGQCQMDESLPEGEGVPEGDVSYPEAYHTDTLPGGVCELPEGVCRRHGYPEAFVFSYTLPGGVCVFPKG